MPSRTIRRGEAMATEGRFGTGANRLGRYVDLFVASFIGLYFEMLLVRWLAAEVRLFSYFKNLTMMAAFMGLAIGFALAKRDKDHLQWFVPLLLLYVPLVLTLSYLTGYKGVVMPEGGEFVWRTATLPPAISTPVFVLVVILFFVYTMLLLLPLGQLTGRLMEGLPSLSAYMVNILGSLAGIWAFAGVSYVYWPPWAWFALGFVVLLWFLYRSRRALVIGVASAVVGVVILVFAQGETLWSPYYRLDLSPLWTDAQGAAVPEESGYNLYANQIGHMAAVNLSPEYLASHPEYAEAFHPYLVIYDLPYMLRPVKKVLVVGSGMGNDVAAALRYGVQRVDAVEIDPLIYDLGLRLHPERPYSEPEVSVIVDDARSYLAKTDERYDLIVFGILDSQTMLSGMSSVRLDNFVYTVEGLRQAKEHLNEGGMIELTFLVERWWIKQRLAQALAEVFGQPPIQLGVAGTAWTTYISGYDVEAGELTALCEDLGCIVEPPLTFDPVPLATDDWPYLYLERRGIPTPYWVVLLVVVAIAWVSARRFFPEARRIDWHFFFLGGAFMLIEFKSITELALLFGSTWIVNAIAVSAVLGTVLLANLMVSRIRRVNVKVLYIFLFVFLILGFVLPLEWFLPHGSVVRWVVSSFLMGVPLFFASAIFATSLKQSQDVMEAFSSNFLGSAVGGMLEYGSLVFGIGSLYVFGAVLYVLAWLAGRRVDS
jgi:SAM-dependent methyltransferase